MSTLDIIEMQHWAGRGEHGSSSPTEIIQIHTGINIPMLSSLFRRTPIFNPITNYIIAVLGNGEIILSPRKLAQFRIAIKRRICWGFQKIQRKSIRSSTEFIGFRFCVKEPATMTFMLKYLSQLDSALDIYLSLYLWLVLFPAANSGRLYKKTADEGFD